MEKRSVLKWLLIFDIDNQNIFGSDFSRKRRRTLSLMMITSFQNQIPSFKPDEDDRENIFFHDCIAED